MKNLKTIYLLLLITIFTITSCTPEDEVDQLIGLWKLIKIDGSTNIGCQNQTTTEFTETEIKTIDYDEVNNNCVVRLIWERDYTINNGVITYVSSPTGTAEILVLDDTNLEIREPEGTGYSTLTFIRQ